MMNQSHCQQKMLQAMTTRWKLYDQDDIDPVGGGSHDLHKQHSNGMGISGAVGETARLTCQYRGTIMTVDDCERRAKNALNVSNFD